MFMVKKAQNTGGGGKMNEVIIGQATYVVERNFSDSKTAADLIADRIVREYEEKASFDGDEGHDV